MEDAKAETFKLIDGTKQFFVDSVRFMRKCNKPEAKEFYKIASSCAIGFLVMGVIGYLIKLVFIPINNIILS